MTAAIPKEALSQEEKDRAFAQIANVIKQYKHKRQFGTDSASGTGNLRIPRWSCSSLSPEMNIPFSDLRSCFFLFFLFHCSKRPAYYTCLPGNSLLHPQGKKIVEHLQDRLQVELGGTTDDGKFTFEVARCIGACGLAPAMMIDDTVYKQVNVNKLDKILEQY